MSFKDRRALAVAVSDGILELQMHRRTDFPLYGKITFEDVTDELLGQVAELAARTKVPWKKQLLGVVGLELATGIQKAKGGDEEAAHKLFVDAEFHFREYEQGKQSKATFIAGPGGEVAKVEE